MRTATLPLLLALLTGCPGSGGFGSHWMRLTLFLSG